METMLEGRAARVLVVEANDRARGWDAAWLDDAGYVVSVCPGPSAPDLACVGSRTGTCPLASHVDAVVLDMAMAGGVSGTGTRAWELLMLYRRFGMPVVVVTSPEDPFVPLPEDGVLAIRRPVERDLLLGALRVLLRSRL
jgi:CheY-like chemotaxis protein